jgi:hypothetical protein
MAKKIKKIFNPSKTLYAIKIRGRYELYFHTDTLIGDIFERMPNSIHFTVGLVNQQELMDLAIFIEQLKDKKPCKQKRDKANKT